VDDDLHICRAVRARLGLCGFRGTVADGGVHVTTLFAVATALAAPHNGTKISSQSRVVAFTN
jgi:hypothetical protein